MKMEPEAWLVDLDGTLYHARWVRLAMAGELLVGGWGALALLQRFRREHERLRGIEDPAANPFRSQLERTAAAVGAEVGVVEQVVTKWMHQRPGKWISLFRRRELLDEIGAFRQAGGRTALVSDYPAAAKLAALQARDLFEVVVASGEPGGPPRLKPSPDGYLAAARRLGVPPERCLVIGDRADADGCAAQAAGMPFRLIR